MSNINTKESTCINLKSYSVARQICPNRTMLKVQGVLLLLFALAHCQNECIRYEDRVDCHPDAGASEENCRARGCTWCPAETGQPWCFVKQDHGYRLVTSESTGTYTRVTLAKNSNASYFGNDFERIIVEFVQQSDYRLRIKISNGEPRYQVPMEIGGPSAGPSNPLYEIAYNYDSSSSPFSFNVKRKGTSSVLLDSSLGGLTFSDQFIQLALRLVSTNVYGIGENEQATFRHSFTGFKKFALWARDQSPDGLTNMYGVMPSFTVLEEDGNAFSVLILNSNAQEFETTPAPGIVYRTIGGIIDMYVFLGPTPENTVQQLTEAVGRTPVPPYWSLGFQLCRWGYNNLENMQAAVNRTRAANIPLDVQWADIDVMDRRLDFTFDQQTFPNFNSYVQELKAEGVRFVPIVDPGIPFEGLNGQYNPLDLGNELDIWVKRPDGTPVVGSVWPGFTYFPDFSKNVTQQYWTEMFRQYKELLNYDGIWIDMNEVASWGDGDLEQGCARNNINYPPYIGAVKNSLPQGTICPDAIQEYGIQYNTHSLYGWKESEATYNALREVTNKRPFVLTRSTFIGVGKWAAHWLGDNFSRWSNMAASIIGMLQYNQFGVPFVGADICGFGDSSNRVLCQRWQELGAFYPFSRNHNADGFPDQDPGMWPEVAEATRKALAVRYTLLPTLYTLFFSHATKGNTVVRALWHEFPLDEQARGVDRQFLWGSGILISPVLEENVTSLRAYFPPAARWFDYYDGKEVATGYQVLDAPLDHINVHVRGGGVYPTQDSAINTMLSRQNPFGLIVALDSRGNAQGSVVVDDGESLDPEISGKYFMAEYRVENKTLSASVLNNGYSVGQTLNTIRLLGAGAVNSVQVNGRNHTSFQTVGDETRITALGLPMGSNFEVTFN